jgi:SCF-associated factor 1
MGDVNTNDESQPKIIPELQNRSVISIVLGDYHHGALTADGQLLTWGKYSHGALGLGVPTELPLSAPGGYSAEAQLYQSRRSQWGVIEPPSVASPEPRWQKVLLRCHCSGMAYWRVGRLLGG